MSSTPFNFNGVLVAIKSIPATSHLNSYNQDMLSSNEESFESTSSEDDDEEEEKKAFEKFRAFARINLRKFFPELTMEEELEFLRGLWADLPAYSKNPYYESSD